MASDVFTGLAREALDRITDNFTVMDAQMRILYVNRTAEALLGDLNKRSEDLVGRSLWEAFPDLADSPLRSRYEQSVATQQADFFDFYYPPLDAWFEIRLYPSASGLSTYSRDITHYKLNQAKLEIQLELAQHLQYAEDLAAVLPPLLASMGQKLKWEVASWWVESPGEFQVRYAWPEAGADQVPQNLLEQARHDGLLTSASVAAFAVNVERKLLGVLALWSSEPRRRSGDLTELLQDVRGQLQAFVERRRLQRELERQRIWSETTLRSIGDAVLATDAEGKVTYLNPCAETLTGWTLAEARGKQFTEVFRIVNEVTREEMEDPVTRVLRENRAVGLANHTLLLSRDGAEYIIEDSAAPIRSPEGETTGVVLVFHDATERHRAARRLAESESNYRRMLDTAYEGVWIADEEYRTTYVNPRVEQLLGYSAQEMMGRPVSDFLNGSSREHLAQSSHERRQGKSAQYELIFLHKDGQEVNMLVSATPLLSVDGKMIGSFAMLTDITEQKSHLRELQKSLERTRSLVEASSQAVLTTDNRGLVEQESPSWTALTGQSFEQMRGAGWLETVHVEDRRRVRSAWLRSVQTQTPFREQFRVWSSENLFLTVSMRGVGVRTEEGEIAEWVLAATDVTRQIEAEQQLRQRAVYATFRGRLRDTLTGNRSLTVVAQEACDAMVAVLDLAQVSIFALDSGWTLLASAGAPLPQGLRAALAAGEDEALRHWSASPRGHLNNTLSGGVLPPPFTGWSEGASFVSQLSVPVHVSGQLSALVVGFHTVVLPVNMLDEVRDAGDLFGLWLLQKRTEDRLKELLGNDS